MKNIEIKNLLTIEEYKHLYDILCEAERYIDFADIEEEVPFITIKNKIKELSKEK